MTKISFNIYHNPRCSKSRKALQIFNSKTKNFEIIKNLKNGIDIVGLKLDIIKRNNMNK